MPRREGSVQFAELLDRVADVDPEMRVRFTSPHPKDFSDHVLAVRLRLLSWFVMRLSTASGMDALAALSWSNFAEK